MMRPKNIIAIIFLILFFVIPLHFIGNAYQLALNETLTSVSTIDGGHPVEVTVKSHTCHQLLPNAVHTVMNPLMCWSCGDIARKLHEDFIIFNPENRCPGRGQVTLLFTRKIS